MGNAVKKTMESEQFFDQAAAKLEWSVAKALLDANSRSFNALEQHLLQTLYLEDSQNYGKAQRCIEQAIIEHERIIEDLTFANEMLDELSNEDKQPLEKTN